MSYLALSTSSLQSTEMIGQSAIGGESQRQSLSAVSIHILDDDSLLNIFFLYQSFLLCDDDDDERLFWGSGGWSGWNRRCWWYKLAHVCQRWRNLVLVSAAYLDISLVCKNGVPVADMLAHSPPLPLIIDYRLDGDNDFTAEDKERAILSFKQYDRVRRVRLRMPATSLQKLIVAIDDEYPILEHLIIFHATEDNSTILTLPETLRAPHLRHLMLVGFALPTGFRLLTNAVGLITLCLGMVNPSTYFHPNILLRWLSFMSQLETLVFVFRFPVSNREVERQLMRSSITTPVILPNLHVFVFRGVTSYLESIIHRITAPRLEKLDFELFNQLTFSIPRLLHFVNTTETLRFESAKFKFSDEGFHVEVYPHEAEKWALLFVVRCCHLDWQVSSAAQISNALSPVFSAVEHLTLEHEIHRRSSEEHNEADRTEWNKLLRSFRNVKTLRIAKGLVEELSRSLRLDEGGHPSEFLPELQELTYSESENTGDAFTPFINALQHAGRPITLSRS